MALPASFKDGEVPEFLTEYYTKADDGTFALNKGIEIDDIGGLRSALGKTKAKADALLKVAKQYGKVKEETWEFEPSVDPTAYGELETKYNQLASQLKDKDGKPVDLKSLIAEQSKERIETERALHQKVLAEAQETAKKELDRIQGKLHETSITQAISTAILKNKGKGQYLEPHVAQLAKLDDDLNVVLMKDGKPIMGKDGANQTVEGYLAELKSSGEWDDAFHIERASGSGSDGATGGRFSGSGKQAEPTLGAQFI